MYCRKILELSDQRRNRLLMLIVLTTILMAVVLSVSVAQQNCCIEVSPGSAMPLDHNWQYDPANPDAPNLMMHAQLCLVNCPTPPPVVMVTGVQLIPGGTGNSVTDINWIRVTFDLNCNGTPDTGEPAIMSSGGFPTSGVLNICNPTLAIQLSPGKCVCVLIEYK